MTTKFMKEIEYLNAQGKSVLLCIGSLNIYHVFGGSCLWNLKIHKVSLEGIFFIFLYSIQKYLGMPHLMLIKINHPTWILLSVINYRNSIYHNSWVWFHMNINNSWVLHSIKSPGQSIVNKRNNCKLVSLFKCSTSNWYSEQTAWLHNQIDYVLTWSTQQHIRKRGCKCD